jgi:hypothetical protein
MESQHWIMLLIVALVFYVIGAKYPMMASRIGFG